MLMYYIGSVYRYIYNKLIWGGSAYVGLAAPGDAGSWQKESKVNTIFSHKMDFPTLIS